MAPSPRICCAIAYPAWRKTRAPATLARTAARVAASLARPEGLAGEISIVLSSNAEVQKLNAFWRGKDMPTNVLSFAAHDAPGQQNPSGADALGDIILAFETCKSEAHAEGKSLENHMTHLVIHGVLHLLGYDHMRDADAKKMMALEIRALKVLDIVNPYIIP